MLLKSPNDRRATGASRRPVRHFKRTEEKDVSSQSKVKIAHLAGPNATIQNSPPLVTSSKARRKYGLPPRKNPNGTDPRFDVLRAQRLAAPVKAYVEQFSAHPLEQDAAELYARCRRLRRH